MHIAISLVFLAYPIYLGYSEAGLLRAAIFAAIFGVVLLFTGPKASEVQGNPSKPLMLFFSLVIASGLTAVGYGIGYLFS
ncbi:MAG: hypothetical protein A2885_13480 [Sphingopyxis sp. RIFCSPHIGHO2_01_FULL_65_24]|nr:MAG: hypothetical protein A2885_13480 [Sphingopyxis sp. RIFCSPHIGHO2_01_FULL_65_24]